MNDQIQPYEVQILGLNGRWTSAGTWADQHVAHAQFLGAVARAEDEGRAESWRMIERRGRGETVLAISEVAFLPVGQPERALRPHVRRDPAEACIDSCARSNVMGAGEARTEYLKARQATKVAEAEWMAKPTAFHAQMLRARLQLQADAMTAVLEQ